MPLKTIIDSITLRSKSSYLIPNIKSWIAIRVPKSTIIIRRDNMFFTIDLNIKF